MGNVNSRICHDCCKMKDESVTEVQSVALDQPKPEMALPGDLRRGVSISFLNGKFLDCMDIGKGCTLTIHDIEPQIRAWSAREICPRDQQLGSAFVDAAVSSQDAGLATIMLSYTWSYRVLAVVRALQAFCEKECLDAQSTNVWICCLCINQHRVQRRRESGQNIPFEEFAKSFGARVRSIGRVVALVAPWNAPLYVQRVWCIYEVYVAEETGVDFSLVLPPEDEEDMLEALADNPESSKADRLWKALGEVRVQDAKASVPDDRSHILHLVESGPGFEHLNMKVRRLLRKWFLEIARRRLTKSLEDINGPHIARRCDLVGQWMTALGDFPGAINVVSAGLGKLGPMNIQTAQDAAALCTSLVWSQYRSGNLAAALEAADQAQDALKCAGAECSADAALLHANVGLVLHKKGDWLSAMCKYDAALRIHEALGTGESQQVASIHTSRGDAMHSMQEFGKAFEAFDHAERIFKKLDLQGSLSSAGLQRKRAAVLVASKQPQEALDILAGIWRETYVALGALEMPDSARTLLTMGAACAALGKMFEAAKNFDNAAVTFELLGSERAAEAHEARRLAKVVRSGGTPDDVARQWLSAAVSWLGT
eukprot:TRINITY_DN34437_c0_g2_i1.p1 TRINITY_DN34437_c0_g2~~TRINITY_DN34437_c0_g2_i1.p1  ORF type:complete len:622 (-),score=98.94 TRINITY_DN34437_c0_g2_i1:20-1813(-)